jgi:non-ribosomal peptide synthetase component E (peptide arylation enzyme)
MAVLSDPDRLAVVCGDMRITTGQLDEQADGGAAVIAASGVEHVAYVGTVGVQLPLLLLFSSVRTATPITP